MAATSTALHGADETKHGGTFSRQTVDFIGCALASSRRTVQEKRSEHLVFKRCENLARFWLEYQLLGGRQLIIFEELNRSVTQAIHGLVFSQHKER